MIVSDLLPLTLAFIRIEAIVSEKPPQKKLLLAVVQ